ncbi:MAG: lytic murein transglycosylase [Maricaulaceae bacterium]
MSRFRRAVGAVCAGLGFATAALAQSEGSDAQTFAEWREAFVGRAADKGYARDRVAELLAGLTPDDRVIRLDGQQPEFIRPIWDYLDIAVSEARVADGRARFETHRDLLTAIEVAHQVDADILTAIWGLESAYGAITGDFDVVRSFATLAYDGRRRAWAESELLTILDLLSEGVLTRGDLVGGWAGAMGQTQFLPSTLAAHGVDWSGDGRIDLRGDVGDALASAARYLQSLGWRTGLAPAVEVALPSGFDLSLAEQTPRPLSDWIALGLARARAAWPHAPAPQTASLILPAGVNGPAFLLMDNFRVLRGYNNATAYALGVSLLADAIARRPGVAGVWPEGEPALTPGRVVALQEALVALGYDPGAAAGVIGPNTRKAVRAYQRAVGLPADGFVTVKLIDQAVAAAG